MKNSLLVFGICIGLTACGSVTSLKVIQDAEKIDGITHVELQYGTDEDQVADLYVIDKTAPLVALVHGGKEDEGDKSHMQGRRKMLTEMGYNVLLPNYRYGREWFSEHPTPSYDLWCSISTALSEGASYDFMPSTVDVYGYSYGGYVGSYMVFDQDFDWSEGCASTQSFNVSKFIGESTFFGSWEGKPENKGALDHLDSSDVPSLLFHGDADPKVNVVNSENFKKALEAAGLSVDLHIIEGGTHHTDIEGKPEMRVLIKEFLR